MVKNCTLRHTAEGALSALPRVEYNSHNALDASNLDRSRGAVASQGGRSTTEAASQQGTWAIGMNFDGHPQAQIGRGTRNNVRISLRGSRRFLWHGWPMPKMIRFGHHHPRGRAPR